MIDGNQNGTKTNDFGAYEYNPLLKETEVLGFVKSSDTHTIFTDAEYSKNKGTSLAANAVGDFIAYDVSIATAGTYAIRARFKKNNNRAIFQLSTAESQSGPFTNFGVTRDLYSANPTFTEINFGSVAFASAGTKAIKFQVTGKNAASSGYNLYFDYIKLSK